MKLTCKEVLRFCEAYRRATLGFEALAESMHNVRIAMDGFVARVEAWPTPNVKTPGENPPEPVDRRPEPTPRPPESACDTCILNPEDWRHMGRCPLARMPSESEHNPPYDPKALGTVCRLHKGEHDDNED